MIGKIYTNEFNDQELNLFNIHEFDKRRKKLMSLYAYMVKHSDNKELRISFEKLRKMYNYSHSKEKRMALTTIKNAIDRLVELGLLKVVAVVRKVNVYSFVRFNFNEYMTNNLNENPTCGKVSETIENTKVEETDTCINTLNNKIDIDIDNKNSKEKSYKEFINSQEKVKTVETVINAAKKIFKNMNVRDKQVQETVINQLTKYFNNITVKFLDGYIVKTIIKTISDLKAIRLKVSQQKKAAKAKTLKFNNFDQRNYDYDSLEKQLLGWENSNKTVADYEIKNTTPRDNYTQNQSCNLKFNNFDQRTYDYDSLEKQLLGWNEE